MATLLSQEWVGGRFERMWAHDNKLTTEIIQDVEPVIDNAKILAQEAKRDSVLGRFVAHVTGTQLEEICRIEAMRWGVPLGECFREVMQGKTERAKAALRILTHGRDYAKLQGKHWR